MASRFEDLSKYQWRTVDGKRQRHVEVRLDEYGSVGTPEELFKRILDAGLLESRIEVEAEQDAYSDSYHAKLVIEGWRDATEAEVAEELAKVDDAKAQQIAYQRRVLEDIRRTNPGLLEES